MKSSKYIYPIFLVLILLVSTGCYTQLRSLDLIGSDEFYHDNDRFYAWNSREEARTGDNWYEREQTAKDFVADEEELQDYGLYYKDYETEDWYRENNLADYYQSGYNEGFDDGYDKAYAEARDRYYSRDSRHYLLYMPRYYGSFYRYYDPWMYDRMIYDPWFYDSFFALRVSFNFPFFFSRYSYYDSYAYWAYPWYSRPYYGYYGGFSSYYGYGNVFVINNYGSSGVSGKRTYGVRSSGLQNAVQPRDISSNKGIVRTRTNPAGSITDLNSGYSKGSRSSGFSDEAKSRIRSSSGTPSSTVNTNGAGSIRSTGRTNSGFGNTGSGSSAVRTGRSSSGTGNSGAVNTGRSGNVGSGSTGSSSSTGSGSKVRSRNSNNEDYQSSVLQSETSVRTNIGTDGTANRARTSTGTSASYSPNRVSTSSQTANRSSSATNTTSRVAQTMSSVNTTNRSTGNSDSKSTVRTSSSSSSSSASKGTTVRKRN